MKLAVIGSRSFSDYGLLKDTLDAYDIDIIISGGARGADNLAEVYAHQNSIPKRIFLPDWGAYGRAAGMIRNKDIVENCDMLIAFWDGESRGTYNSIQLAEKLGKPAHIVQFLQKGEGEYEN